LTNIKRGALKFIVSLHTQHHLNPPARHHHNTTITKNTPRRQQTIIAEHAESIVEHAGPDLAALFGRGVEEVPDVFTVDLQEGGFQQHVVGLGTPLSETRNYS
jgi:hypothetical protein